MSWVKEYTEERSARDPEFKAAVEAEAAILALVRARKAAGPTQEDVARALHVSQPYVAQIERGTRPANFMLVVRYATRSGRGSRSRLARRRGGRWHGFPSHALLCGLDLHRAAGTNHPLTRATHQIEVVTQGRAHPGHPPLTRGVRRAILRVPCQHR